MDYLRLYQLAHTSLLSLATKDGINASGKNEIFGCIFGRDTALTILKILRAQKKQSNPDLLEISKRALLTLVKLQGVEFNIESGEQPGKFIHEFRRTDFAHLLAGEKPWYIYPDGLLRNYDSIDSTPLVLIALYRYWEITQDNEFLISVLPSVEAGLNWIITFGDIDKDQLLEYEFSKDRCFGGLSVQSWTDSHQSIVQPDGTMPPYPIAPIEVQAFAWLALKLWTKFYQTLSPIFAQKLNSFADDLQKSFHKRLLLQDQSLIFGAQALDGEKQQISTITANPLLCLWASYEENGKIHSILDKNMINDFVKRALMDDLFVKNAGIRTMSSLSPTFNPKADSYHNGSFWPILNGLIVEGLENWGYFDEAQELKISALAPLVHFGTPIELYIKNDEGYLEYCSSTGQNGCRHQAWSAAALLDLTAS